MSIRNLRKENNISYKVLLELHIKVNTNWSNHFDSLLIKIGNLSSIIFTENIVAKSYSFIAKNNEFFVPFIESIDLKAESLNIFKEIENKKEFLLTVLNKLNNKRFVENAPKNIVDLELKKKDDAEKQIKILEERLKKFEWLMAIF